MNLWTTCRQLTDHRLGRQTRQGSLGFACDPAYLALSDPMPLSLSFPLRDGLHPNRVVRAFLDAAVDAEPGAPSSRSAYRYLAEPVFRTTEVDPGIRTVGDHFREDAAGGAERTAEAVGAGGG
jgi:hypothetical protein